MEEDRQTQRTAAYGQITDDKTEKEHTGRLRDRTVRQREQQRGDHDGKPVAITLQGHQDDAPKQILLKERRSDHDRYDHQHVGQRITGEIIAVTGDRDGKCFRQQAEQQGQRDVHAKAQQEAGSDLFEPRLVFAL